MGFTFRGNWAFSMRPSTCSIVTLLPTVLSSGCSTTKPVRAVRKSVFGIAVPLNARLPFASPVMLTSKPISRSPFFATA